MRRYDAVVVGSGPNGLAAAITIARAGRSVCVLESAETAGGGMRSEELTRPGFIHDICAAVHPLGASSPLFRRLNLERYGVEWVQPTLPMAHPFDDGTAAVLHPSLEAMAEEYPEDGAAYSRLLGPLVDKWRELAWEFLQPVVHRPRHPLLLARFGIPSLLSASRLAKLKFKDPRLQALISGTAAHAILPPDQPLTASFGLVLNGAAHAVGWPFVRGGTQQLADGLVACLESYGGEIRLGTPVRSMEDLPPHRVALFDVSPESLLTICGDQFPESYRRRMLGFRRGNAVFKVDFALSGEVPWAAAPCRDAGTLHLGGDLDEVISATHDVKRGKSPERPFVLAAQPSKFDPMRAPEGQHTLWAYCHVPTGDTADLTDRIEAQVERFAPGFRELILDRSSRNARDLEAHNPNLVGGDITGGSNAGLQLFFRPTLSLQPYRTPAPGVYLCSASTPPGGGVHGMPGYWAARAALKRELRSKA